MTVFLFTMCIFLAVWQGILFFGNAFNRTLGHYGSINILLFALSITGIITHVIDIW